MLIKTYTIVYLCDSDMSHVATYLEQQPAIDDVMGYCEGKNIEFKGFDELEQPELYQSLVYSESFEDERVFVYVDFLNTSNKKRKRAVKYKGVVLNVKGKKKGACVGVNIVGNTARSFRVGDKVKLSHLNVLDC